MEPWGTPLKSFSHELAYGHTCVRVRASRCVCARVRVVRVSERCKSYAHQRETTGYARA